MTQPTGSRCAGSPHRAVPGTNKPRSRRRITYVMTFTRPGLPGTRTGGSPVRRTLTLTLLAAAALLAATPAASPAFAAPSARAGKPAPPPAPPPPPPPPSTSSFIKAFVDTRASNNAAFGGDVAQAADGTYYVVGSVGIPGAAWVAHVSATGTLIWQEQFTNTSFASVQATADGGVVVAGGSVVKLSSAGVVQWEKTYPGLFEAAASQIQQTTDGGYIVVGNTRPQSNSDPFAWIARLTSTGDLMWQRVLGTPPFANAASVAQLPSGGFAITGSSGAIDSSSVLVAEFSATGDLQWQKTYGIGHDDLGESIQVASDGSLVIGGELVTINQANAAQPGLALLLKLTPNGDIVFQDQFKGDSFFDINDFPEQHSSEATSVQVAPNGDYILAGRDGVTGGLGGPEASWLAETDASGKLLFQHVFAVGSEFSLFSGMRLTSDGGFIAIGTTGVFANSDNAWLVKTDASGNVAGCNDQGNGSTTEQSGPLTEATSSFPVVTPSSSATDASDTPATTSLVTMAVC